MRYNTIKLYLKHSLATNICSFSFKQTCKYNTGSMELKEVVNILESFAPKKLAADWDNVGLLLEPSNHTVKKLMLTNDLTLKVLEEAISTGVSMVLSYHPPIFKSFKRLRQEEWKESLVVGCLENRIAIYSPHTAWDCISGGVNDWLIKPFVGRVEVLQEAACDTKLYRVEVQGGGEKKGGEGSEGVGAMEARFPGVTWNKCTDNRQYTICGLQQAHEISDSIGTAAVCQQVVAFPEKKAGFGRLVRLEQASTIKKVLQQVKSHLKLQHLQLALANNTNQDSPVTKIACCAGSGAEVLRGVKADVYLTGEMSHHDLLDCTNNLKGCAASVILCNHSNSERGFLAEVVKGYLEGMMGDKVEVVVSSMDADPLMAV